MYITCKTMLKNSVKRQNTLVKKDHSRIDILSKLRGKVHKKKDTLKIHIY